MRYPLGLPHFPNFCLGQVQVGAGNGQLDSVLFDVASLAADSIGIMSKCVVRYAQCTGSCAGAVARGSKFRQVELETVVYAIVIS